MGYVRGRCARYPQTDAGDAVRFLVARDRDDLIRIEFVVERDHHPYAHGTLEYSRALRRLADPDAASVLNRQALAYVESYLRRRPSAAH